MPELVGSLDELLAAIRLAESGSLQGNYANRGPMENGKQPFGAYGILQPNWEAWAAMSGLKGANIHSPQAQDLVAASVLNAYYDRFGSWDLAAVAWYAGPTSASKMVMRGWKGIDSIQNPQIKGYLDKVSKGLKEAQDPVNSKYLTKISPRRFTGKKGGGSWIMPVAGESEWSGGSWMPNQLTHRGRTHGAIDIYAQEGTPIVAPVGGKVISVKTGDIGGHTVKILGDDGIEYYIAHMAAPSVRRVGDKIQAGHHLGYVGRSGSAKNTKPHAHFSMKQQGRSINPVSYLQGASTTGLVPNSEDATLDDAGSGIRNNLSDWANSLSNAQAGGQRKPLPSIEEEKANRLAKLAKADELGAI